jgi:hypothetical protein
VERHGRARLPRLDGQRHLGQSGLLQQVLVLLVLVGPVLTDDRPSWFWPFLVAVVVWELLLVRDFARWWRSRAEQEPS